MLFFIRLQNSIESNTETEPIINYLQNALNSTFMKDRDFSGEFTKFPLDFSQFETIWIN